MEPKHFDQFARIVGASGSRRGILKALAGGVLGALTATAGYRETIAAKKRSAGNICAQNVDCASNRCVTVGRNRKVCQCGSMSDCPQPKDQCQLATCSSGACGVAVNVGAPCNDGNACTTSDSCQPNGACVGTPIACVALDQCHAVGLCDPKTGVCSNPIKQNSAACNDGDLCTQTDQCQNGVCTGSNPVVCVASHQCHEVGACDPATGTCSNPARADGAACQAGGQPQACQGGVCCTPTTCEAQGVACGSVSDGCNVATLQCGNCPSGMACSDGTCICPTGSVMCGAACERGACCVDSDCDDRGICYTRACNFRQVGQGFRNVCDYTHQPGCCTANSDCSPDPCDVSVTCDLTTNQCVHVSACSSCNVCDPNTGGCTGSNCPNCQYCGPGGICKADPAVEYDVCTTSQSQSSPGICSEGDCLTCLPNDRLCQGVGSGDECCSGKCLPNGLGQGAFVCTCRTLIELCDNDAQCCQGNCAYDNVNAGKVCQPGR